MKPDFSMKKINEILAAAYTEQDFPAAFHQTKLWAKTRPLEGLTVIEASPIFRNTMTKYRALVAAGARLIIGIRDGIIYDAAVVELMREAGFRIVRWDDTPFEVDLILDNAGGFSAWKPRLGFAELTRSGYEKYKNSDKPVFLADGGRIKRIETFLGTGESFYRAMAQRGYADWAGKKLVIFGSGKVGSGLIFYAKQKGAYVVSVTDPASVSEKTRERIDELVDFRDTAKTAQVVADAFAAVTATGICGALDRDGVPEALVASSALLANMGVEDEFGPRVPAERVLGEKRSLNFFLEEPTHLKYIDATLALHSAGAVYLAQNAGKLPSGIILPPADIEDEILRITRERGCIAEEMDFLN
ncbi:MAG: hypothetical protein IJN19_06040 [Opitutales bacterium]|nr:hypothetical protein [Opitutales bacterium]